MDNIQTEFEKLKAEGMRNFEIGNLYHLRTSQVKKILSLKTERDRLAVDLKFRGNFDGTAPGLPGLSTRSPDDKPKWHKKVYGSG
jgi:hypothetical protein